MIMMIVKDEVIFSTESRLTEMLFFGGVQQKLDKKITADILKLIN